MSTREEAVVFDCAGESLVGVIASPERAAETGVVVVVGGPQYRAGSHRHFVQLARSLAAAGYPTLRFDCRGMGDSSGTQRSFEDLDQDVGAAIDSLLQRAPQVKRVVLWGLCDGASASLLYLHRTADLRVAGICLLNPWVRSEVSLARTHVKHYYLQRLGQPEFWRKFLSGKVAADALAGVVRNVGLARSGGNAATSFQQRMAAALAAFRGPVLLLLSENDFTAKEFIEYTRADAAWRDALDRPRARHQMLEGADHTLSNPGAKALVEQIVVRWLRDECPAVIPQEPNSVFDGHATP